MDRIPLTSSLFHIHDEGVLIICEPGDEDKLEKQILDDNSKAQWWEMETEKEHFQWIVNHGTDGFKDLKEKAEILDKIIKQIDDIEKCEPRTSKEKQIIIEAVIGRWVIRNQKLEQENKKLKIRVENTENAISELTTQNTNLNEITQKVKEILDELERTDYGYWTLEMLYEKLCKILKEKP